MHVLPNKNELKNSNSCFYIGYVVFTNNLSNYLTLNKYYLEYYLLINS